MEKKQKSVIFESFKNFCLDSSAHGLPRIFSDEIRVIRIFWTVSFLTGLGFSIGISFFSLSKYFSYDYLITIERSETYLDDFPGISICNINPFETSDPEVIDYLNQTLVKNNLTAMIEASSQISVIYKVRQAMKILKANFLSERKKIKQMYPNDTFKFVHTFNKMVLSCYFNGKICKLDDFDFFFNFDYALCLTFNGKNGILKKTSMTGPGSGLSLELFAGMHDFLIEKRGFYLAVHNNSILPSINFEGIKLSVGEMTEIGIKRTYFYKLGEPYSKCRKDTQNYIELDSESYRITVQSGVYNRRTCFEICLQIKFIEPECNCSDPQIPFNQSEASLCKNHDEITCVEKIRDKFDSNDLALMCGQDCPISCDTIEYDYLVSHSDYPSKYYYNVIKMQPNVEEKFRHYGSLNYSLFKQSSLMVNVFYQELSSTIIKESKATYLPDLLSKIGGIMGLFFGCSLITLLEPLELLINIIYKIRKNRKQLNKNRSIQ